MVDNIYSKHSHFSLLLSIVLSIDCNYDYTMDYMPGTLPKNIRATLSIRKAKTR